MDPKTTVTDPTRPGYPRQGKRFNELTDKYATLYSNREFMRLGINDSTANDR